MADRIPLLDCPVHHRQPGDGSANNGRFWRYCGARGCELSTAWVLSRNEAITSWNDLVARLSKPVERKLQEVTMAEREPLAGWRGNEPDKPEVWWHAPLRLSINPHVTPVPWGGAWFGADGFGMVWLPFGGDAATVLAAQLAAEDAARALVADMAAALGGRVTWGESEVSECR